MSKTIIIKIESISYLLFAVLFIMVCLVSVMFVKDMYQKKENYNNVYLNSPDYVPGDYIKEQQIHVWNDSFCVYNLTDVIWSDIYNNSFSMNPTLANGHHTIQVAVNSFNELKIGDIISYERNETLVIHRVIDKGEDEEGLFLITKGDNCIYEDRKVRMNQVKDKVIAIIY